MKGTEPLSRNANIVFCGFTSSGKTTIGRLLAEHLGWPFTDTDTLLTETFHMTIPEMFAAGGEAYFRRREEETARIAAGLMHTVIATGGGMMENEENARVLSEHGVLIYINQDFDTCYARLCSNPERPLLKKYTREQLKARYEARVPGYRKYAAYTLTNPASPDAALKELLGFLGRGRMF